MNGNQDVLRRDKFFNHETRNQLTSMIKMSMRQGISNIIFISSNVKDTDVIRMLNNLIDCRSQDGVIIVFESPVRSGYLVPRGSNRDRDRLAFVPKPKIT